MFEEKISNILLIEDNPGDARLILEYLKESFIQNNPEIAIAEDLESACQQIQENEYDIVLLDLSLPDSFGLETLENVIRFSGYTPIIVLTGLDDEQIGIDAVEAGAQDYLVKKELNATLLGRSILYAIQRNQLNQQFKKSEARLFEAQRLAKLGNFEQDLENGELIWSDELFRIFEMDPEDEEPSFEGLLEMIHPEDRDITIKTVEKVRRDEKRQYLEICITPRSGTKKFIHNIINPVKNHLGEVVKVFGTTHDITERKKAEEQLKENERRYRMLFQATTDEILVFQVDKNLKPQPFIEVNGIACDMLGYTREELQKKTIYEVVAADKSEVDRRIEYIMEHNQVVRESKHKRKDGSIIPLEISARSFTYNGQNTIISIGRDISKRRKLEQEILNISEQERRRIGRDMHDSLGQMLTGIGLIARNLAKNLKTNELPGAKDAGEIADMIHEADEHARALSRGLVPVNVESNGLDAALRELTSRNSKIFGIEVNYMNGEVNLLEDVSKAVHLYRIAQEAINNAIKHGKATKVDVGLSSSEAQITLYIEDNGKGFPEPGEFTDGMGVQIMNFRSNMIGGNLKINSEVGKGTRIICKIPRTQKAEG